MVHPTFRSKYYCQTVLFSSFPTPEIVSLFLKHCHSYEGRVTIHAPLCDGSIRQVATPIPQVRCWVWRSRIWHSEWTMNWQVLARLEYRDIVMSPSNITDTHITPADLSCTGSTLCSNHTWPSIYVHTYMVLASAICSYGMCWCLWVYRMKYILHVSTVHVCTCKHEGMWKCICTWSVCCKVGWAEHLLWACYPLGHEQVEGYNFKLWQNFLISICVCWRCFNELNVAVE